VDALVCSLVCDVHHRRAGADHLCAQCLLALGVVVGAVVFGERFHHRGDRLAEAVADVLDAARRVLDDVVQEADDLQGPRAPAWSLPVWEH
jgi:hypothetical protein